ncbi:MAG: YicC family protein [Clostridia bacterium]|nr:YicC family protein [Clostridia bacterium]
MYSMTGYGKAEYLDNGINLTVEIKTVNNRNFDFNAKMPRTFISLEDKIRNTVSEYIKRARIDLFINFKDFRENEQAISVNVEKAVEYYNASKTISEKLGLANDCSVSMLMKFPDVIEDNSVLDATELEEIIINTVKGACEKLNAMRKIEGEKLVKDLLSKMDDISSTASQIKERAPLVAQEYKEKLQKRIEEALKDIKYDETRLLNEVAFFTDKVNIDEELTRLNSHINQFREIVKIDGMGKKLDFLMQEFNRETNTICSKSNDIEITRLALILKNEIEMVREQVQNLE